MRQGGCGDGLRSGEWRVKRSGEWRVSGVWRGVEDVRRVNEKIRWVAGQMEKRDERKRVKAEGKRVRRQVVDRKHL